PRPKVAFGLALPTGCESIAEYLDIELTAPVELVGLAQRVSDALPVGVDVFAVEELDGGGESLQQAVTSCTWVVDVGEDAPQVAAQILATDALPAVRERKGRTVTD